MSNPTQRKGFGLGLNKTSRRVTTANTGNIIEITAELNEQLKAAGSGAKATPMIANQLAQGGIRPAYDGILIHETREGSQLGIYYPIFLGDTGADEPVGTAILAAHAAKERVYVPTDTFDKHMNAIILELLGNEKDWIKSEGVFIPEGISRDGILAEGKIADAAFVLAMDMFDGFADINLELDRPENTTFEVAQATAPANIITRLGTHKSTKWGVSVDLASTKAYGYTGLDSINTGDSKHRIVKVSGDFLYTFASVPATIPGYPDSTVAVANLVINNMKVGEENQIGETINTALLGIVAASTMIGTDENGMNREHRHHIVGTLNREDVGILKHVTHGEAIKLNDKKLSLDRKTQEVLAIVADRAALCMDISQFGESSDALAVISSAADTGDANCDIARRKLITSAMELTNGAFPEDYPLDQIFAGSPIVLPEGIFQDKKGDTRPISDVSPVFILNELGVNGIALAYRQVNLMAGGNMVDPFIEQLAIIAELGFETRVASKIRRVTFNPGFIATLAHACARVGFTGNLNAPIGVMVPQDFTNAVNPLAMAAVTSPMPTFQREKRGAVGYATPFIMSY